GLRASLRGLDFHLAGRFAEWEYYNMDKAMERAMEVVADIQQNT
ncbi:MAG TPA: UDP-galactopyranose mutase, partial [Bacteroidales bacterium]|nr:UDP-galactopyranose mutase [Bacteroidales bacterium]